MLLEKKSHVRIKVISPRNLNTSSQSELRERMSEYERGIKRLSEKGLLNSECKSRATWLQKEGAGKWVLIRAQSINHNPGGKKKNAAHEPRIKLGAYRKRERERERN